MQWIQLFIKRKKWNHSEQKSFRIHMKNRKNYYICKEKLENKYLTDKRYGKVRDHCHYTENIEVVHIGYVIQNIVYLKIFL